MAKDEFYLEQPISIWNRELKVNIGDLFKGLSKAVSSSAKAGAKTQSGDPSIKELSSALSGLIDTIRSVKLAEISLQQKAWKLLFIALCGAAEEIVFETAQNELLVPKKQNSESLADEIEKTLNESLIAVDSKLLTSPRTSPIVNLFRPHFISWLEHYGLDEGKAIATAGRLDSIFALKFRQEWRKNYLIYKDLTAFTETPADADVEKATAWLEYEAHIENQIHRPLFAECFSLSDIYVSLRGMWHKEIDADATKHRKPIWVEDHLKDWALNSNSDDSLRVISGGPGSGKSSLCKKFVADNISELKGHGIGLLLIQLHEFNPEGDLQTAITKYLQENQAVALDWNILRDEAFKSVLLVFDGLDELSESGKTGAEIARKFTHHLNQQLQLANAGPTCRLRAILTGREIVVQALQESELRTEAALICLVSYLGCKRPDPDYEDDENRMLALDQRDEWWSKYGKASGLGYNRMPEELKGRNLEITQEPLLNYLVALIYVDGFKFTEHTSRNEIYENLIKRVFKAEYRDSRTNISGLKWEEFLLVLEEIALAVWRNGGRKASLSHIEKHCDGVIPKDWFDQFEAKAEKGYTRLLTAFYFRQSGGNDKSFEFTHKSFGEYLMARRLVTLMKEVFEQRQIQEKLPRSGWTEVNALIQWELVTGANQIDRYLLEFLVPEVQSMMSMYKKGKQKRFQSTFSNLLLNTVVHGCPINGEFPKVLERANNSDESLIAALYSIHKTTGNISKINWPHDLQGKFCAWLARFPVQNIGIGFISPNELSIVLDSIPIEASKMVFFQNGNSVLRKSLGGLYFKRLHLIGVDFSDSNLRGTKFNDVMLFGARFKYAQLNGATLKNVMAIEADFSHTSMSNTQIRGGGFMNANFSHAKVTKSTLKGCSFRGADFSNADLSGSDLRKSDLSKAVFTDCKMNKVQMGGAKISRDQLSDDQATGIVGEPAWLDADEEET